MKNLILFLIVITQFSFAQEEKQIHLVVESDNVPEGSSIYITGNHPSIGNWKADVVRLKMSEDNKWGITLSLPAGFHLEYKFTLGSWKREALNKDGLVPANNVLDVMNDTTIRVRIDLWANGQKRIVEGQVTGTIEYYRNFKGKGIKDRDIVVWLPPGYFENTYKYYPVLYMHDGQNVFDPKTSAFGADWQMDETADSLIKRHLIKPIIIVGVYNTPDRSSEYAANDTGYAYMNFIIYKLKSFIDSVYRTLPDRENTATGGSSLAGLISFMLIWKHSDVFSMAACLSPAFKIERYDFVTPVKKYSGTKKQIRLYIDNGGIGIDTLLQDGVNKMIAALTEKGYTVGKDLYHFKDSSAGHNEKFWSKRIWRPLIFMFGNEDSKKLLK